MDEIFVIDNATYVPERTASKSFTDFKHNLESVRSAFMRNVFMRYPEGKMKAVTFSYDDGVPQDKRLAELFDKYGMKATFNFNGSVMKKQAFSK